MTFRQDAQMGDGRPKYKAQVLRWAMYDIASSNYHAIVPAFFGLYFLSVAGAGNAAAKAWWGAAVAMSLLVAAVLAPLVGAWADRTGRWFGALFGLTCVCVLGTLLLPLTARAGLFVGCLLFVVAQTGYTVASSVYDSLVVEVAPASHRARASAIGWSLGLVGGLAATFAALALVEGYGPERQVVRLELAFLAAGALFAALAVPGLAGVRGAVARRTASASTHGLAATAAHLADTFRRWREHRELLKLIGSFLLVNDVLVTLQFFIAVVLASKFGIAVDGILRLLALGTLVAIPSTLVWGVLADRWGARRCLVLLSLGLGGGVVLLAFSEAPWIPTLAFVLFGFVYGSVQALYRAFYASLVPAQRAAEFFGFNAVAGRLSAAAGPLVFGVVATLWGDSAALLTLLVPLLLGIVLLSRVKAGAASAASCPSTA
jgi:UMF1 family MFS transporter